MNITIKIFRFDGNLIPGAVTGRKTFLQFVAHFFWGNREAYHLLIERYISNIKMHFFNAGIIGDRSADHDRAIATEDRFIFGRNDGYRWRRVVIYSTLTAGQNCAGKDYKG